jgi:hypothetical protein
MKAVVITRSFKKSLYEKMKNSCKELPFKALKAGGFDGMMGSLKYLFVCCQFYKSFDWIINIDEDALVTDPSALLSLLTYMEKNRFDMCGMPDGGCSIRDHNPVAMQPFLIYLVKSLRKISF